MLESYAWVDKSAGVVRIPIERAIEVLAERGAAASRGAASRRRRERPGARRWSRPARRPAGPSAHDAPATAEPLAAEAA